MFVHWFVFKLSVAFRGALSLSQANIVNNNGNYNVGDGPVTNNNWAINIIQTAKDQVRILLAIAATVLMRFLIVSSRESHCL